MRPSSTATSIDRFPSGQASLLRPWHKRGGITERHAGLTLYFDQTTLRLSLSFDGDEDEGHHTFALTVPRESYDTSNSALVGAVDVSPRSNPVALDRLRRAFGTDRVFVKVIETLHGPNLFKAEADHCAALSLLGATVAPSFVHFYGTCRAIDVGPQRSKYRHHQALFMQAAERPLSAVLYSLDSPLDVGAWAAAACHVLLGLHALAGYLGITHGDAAMRNAVVLEQSEPVVRHVVLVSGSPVPISVPAIPLGDGRWGRVALIDALVLPSVDILGGASRQNLASLQRLFARSSSRGMGQFDDLYGKMQKEARWKTAKMILDEAADFLSPGHRGHTGHPAIAVFLRREKLAITPPSMSVHASHRSISIAVSAEDYERVHRELMMDDERRAPNAPGGFVRVSLEHWHELNRDLEIASNLGGRKSSRYPVDVVETMGAWRIRLDAEALKDTPRMKEPRDDAVLRMVHDLGVLAANESAFPLPRRSA